MQGDEAPPQAGQIGEQRPLAHERHAREVGFQEGRVAAAVCRAVEHGVEGVEHVLGAERGYKVARAVGNEIEAERRPHRLDEARREIRRACLSEALRAFRRVDVEGEEVIDLLERHRVMLRENARNENMLPASRYLRRSSRREAQVLPRQHVAHDVRTRADDETAGPAGVPGEARIERPVEDGRDVPVRLWMIANVPLCVCDPPVAGIPAE